MEGLHFAIDYVTCTYRYLQGAQKLHAARKPHRAARKPSEIPCAPQLAAVRAHLMKGVYVAVDRTTRTWRHLQAVRGYDEPLPKHADTITYIRYLLRCVLLGFWPEKLTLGLAFVIWGCVFNAGIGRCWLTVGYVVAFLLFGPLYVLVDAVILALGEWWVSVQLLNQEQRWD